MKIEQKRAKFKPITITLETRKEADALFEFVEMFHTEAAYGSAERQIAIDISNGLMGKV